MMILISFLFLGTWNLNKNIQARERNIQRSFNSYFNKKEAIDYCNKALFYTTSDMCIKTYSIKFHDPAMCNEIKYPFTYNSCVEMVNCSYFHPLYKTWTTNNSKCKEL